MTGLPAAGGISSTMRRRLFLAWTLWMWLAWIFSGEFARFFSMSPLVRYFLSPPWPHLADSAGRAALALGTVLLILSSSFLCGRAVLLMIFGKRVSAGDSSKGRRVFADSRVIRLATGFPALALLVQGLALCGLLFPSLLTGLVCALSAAWAIAALRHRLPTRGAVRVSVPGEGESRGRTLSLSALCVLSGLIVAAAAMAPEVAWDAVVYHLRVPTLYLAQHKAYAIPGIFPSYFPSSGQMLLLLAKQAGGDQAARLLHACAWLACGFAVARIAGAIWGSRAAPWAMALFMTLPIACTIAARAYVEFFLILPAAACILVFVRQGNLSLSRAALAGWLAGGVLGVKYAGGLIALILWIVLAVKTRWRLAPSTVFWLSTAAVSGSWLLKNQLLTGNPVYPVFFGGIHWTPEDSRGWQADASAFFFDPMTLLTSPWTLLNSRGVDGGISPMLLAAAPAPLLWPESAKGRRAVWFLILALFLAWWITSPLARYLLPALALLCAAVSGTLGGWKTGRPTKITLETLALLGMACSLGFCISSIHYGTEPYAASLGKIPSSEYRARRFGPKGFVETLSRAEETTRPEERVYMLGHTFSYDLPRRVWFDFLYLRPSLYWWLEGADSAERIRIRARQAKLKVIAHTRTGGIRVTGRRAPLMSWTPRKLHAYLSFWTSYVYADYSVGDWDVYRIAEKPGSYPFPAGHLPGAEGITVPIDEALEFKGMAEAIRLAGETAARYPFFPYAEARFRFLLEKKNASEIPGAGRTSR